MSKPIITLENVGLRYKKRQWFFHHSYYQALESISLDLFEGETFGILGRNGCGKSTLLRLMAGIYLPDSGHIETNDAHISLLSLSVGFDPELSGRDNIIISAMLLGATRSDAYNAISEIIDFSELGSFIDEPVKTYSSGMQMRLGFSIAISIRPDVLLIDEVLGVGDAHFKKKAEAAIIDKISSHQTVVLVSHNSSQIVDLCDRAMWLEGGVIKMQGNPKEVVDSYEAFLINSWGVGAGSQSAAM